MASPALLKRLDDLEARLGAGAQVSVGRACMRCGAHVQLGDDGPCQTHRPLPPADLMLLVTFVNPDD